jgi:hypothetical protein
MPGRSTKSISGPHQIKIFYIQQQEAAKCISTFCRFSFQKTTKPIKELSDYHFNFKINLVQSRCIKPYSDTNCLIKTIIST